MAHQLVRCREAASNDRSRWEWHRMKHRLGTLVLLIVTLVTVAAMGVPASAQQPGVPPNDDFENAEEISGNSGQVSAMTLGATSEPGEPDHDTSEAGPDPS